jgi:hypothetical protein
LRVLIDHKLLLLSHIDISWYHFMNVHHAARGMGMNPKLVPGYYASGILCHILKLLCASWHMVVQEWGPVLRGVFSSDLWHHVIYIVMLV